MAIVLIGGNQTSTPQSADEIGGKAANLARLAAFGLPVPPAFVLPISLCARVSAGDSDAERELDDGIRTGIEFLERETGKRFGDRRRPLLVSVRSGAARSMPGMMDTVLDVGATSEAVAGLTRMTGDPRFAWDCRQRFVESYATVVLGLDPAPFAAALARIAGGEQVASAREFDCEAMERLALGFAVLAERSDWLDDPLRQLVGAARAVYASWMSERAQTYRRLQNLNDLHGTAVTVQAMVFGNRGLTSGAGVAFSRDPSTGEPQPMIDVLFDAQGEEVVSGRRTPQTEAAIVRALPLVAVELRDVLRRLEREFGDMQDVEFTIENGRLWILQTRSAKRTPLAALRIALDLVHEGLIAPGDALRLLGDVDLNAIERVRFDTPGTPIAYGIGASGGVASGRAAFDSASAEHLASGGSPVVLVRPDTSTADVAGFARASGIVTARGGRTAHAALVARQMGKPSVVGCEALCVDVAERRGQFGDAVIREGEWIAIDGDSGAIYLGSRTVVRERPVTELAEIARWRQHAERCLAPAGS
jgi:pyruvate,orthophosphate dikinase